VRTEQLSSALKDKFFVEMMTMDCLSHVEANRMVNAVDAFVPFFPLEREHVEQVGSPNRRV
jgi:hypothetical protein